MNNKDKVKYFYGEMIAKNIINEIYKFISDDNAIKVGKKGVLNLY
ncbi:MAG: hypothetical protein ACK5LC_16155 [Coprobacillaceae bacterium]